MNATAQALVIALASVAAAVAIGTGLADQTQPSVKIVQLDRVVVTGKRAEAPVQVVQLPRVVVTGRRVAEAQLMASSRDSKNS
jgi:hypothetical protein